MPLNHQAGNTTTGTKKILFVPLLPVIFFFLHNFNLFKELLLTKEVAGLLFIYSAVILIVELIIKKLFKLSPSQSALPVTILAICFLFFGALQDFFLGIAGFTFLSDSLLIVLVYLFILVILITWIKKKNPALTKATRYFVLVFTILIAIEIGSFLLTVYNGRTVSAITKKMTSSLPLSALPLNDKTTPNERPDIYHILFDSYTNAPCLRRYWGFENDIYSFLDSCGFYTIDSGFSNYNFTPYSVSSTFNMQYLQGAEEFITPNSASFYIGNRSYHNNVLFKFLEKQQYSFSIFSVLESEKSLLRLGYLAIGPPESWLRKQTLERIYLNPWITHKIKKLFSKEDRLPASVLESMQHFGEYNLAATEHIFSDCKNSLSPGHPPVFSFTHLMLPHEPYLMNENGKFIASPNPEDPGRDGYLQQLKYANKLIRQITDCLLSDTTRNKIIIFQGDHGFRHYTDAPNSATFGALDAVYFYNKNYKGLKKDMSLVNTYRTVINNVYNGSLPLLRDSIVIIKDK